MSANVNIWLYDAEPFFKQDKLMSGTITPNRQTGEFKIVGQQTEFTDIEPYIKVQHWCNVKKGQNPIEFCIDVPKQFVYYGAERKKFWKIDMELSNKVNGQRKCPRLFERELKKPRVADPDIWCIALPSTITGKASPPTSLSLDVQFGLFSVFVTFVYLFTKISYLANREDHNYLCNTRFLETEKYAWYGFDAMIDLLDGTIWEQSGVFPRVSLCDFDVPDVVDFYFGIIPLLVIRCNHTAPQSSFHQEALEKCHLIQLRATKTCDALSTAISELMVFVIRMLTLQFGVIFGADLVLALWKSFFDIEEQLKRSNSMPDVQKAVDDESRFWPPPPAPLEDNELRFRRALG